MDRQDQILYHQIHPFKLSVDWVTGLFSVELMWQHQFVIAMIVAFLPAPVASALVISAANLEPYKDSALGRYLKTYMTPLMQVVRLAGQIVMWIGAWLRRPWIVGSGLLIILFGWFNGLIFPRND